MKYCIYAGAIYKVTSESGKLIYLSGLLDNETATVDQVKAIPEEIYLSIKDEYESAVNELRNVSHRIYRLNEEYHKKHEALQDMRMEAGRKEKAVIGKVLEQLTRDKF